MLNYRRDIGLVTLDDDDTGVRVGTLLQSDKPQRGARNAYAMARFSRKPLDISLVSILEELESKDSKTRIENIVHNYGHSSVADLAAGQFVFIENISVLDTLRFHYHNYFYASQESSTRYITINTDRLDQVRDSIKIPKALSIDKNKEPEKDYINICTDYFKNYNGFIDRFKEVLAEYYEVEHSSKTLHSRALDCARYFLPLATKVGLGVTMSARKWSGELKRLLRSPYKDDNSIYKLLNQLLVQGDEYVKEYIPEADSLLRHIDGSSNIFDLVNLSNNILDGYVDVIELYPSNIKPILDNNKVHIGSIKLINKLKALNNPYSYIDEELNLESQHIKSLASFINSNFNRYEELPRSLFSSSDITVSGYTDIGSFKDLNRHRSAFRFCPVLENYSLLYYDLLHNYDLKSFITIPPYINHILEDESVSKELRNKVNILKEDYLNSMGFIIAKALNLFYRLIADTDIDLQECSYIISHLLPHGFIIPYTFSLDLSSLTYIADLRTRAGAHISYSLLVRDWVEALSKDNNSIKDEMSYQILLSIKDSLNKEDPFSREMFVGRS